MNEMKQCNNGHFYREDVVKCPICSEKEIQDSYTENTVLDNGYKKDSLQTKLNKTDKIKKILQEVITFFSNFRNKFSIFSIEEDSFFSFLKNKFFYINFISASIVTLFLFWSLLPLIDSYTSNGEEFELKDFQGLFIEDVSNELEQLGLKYQIIDSVFIDSLDGVKVTKGTIFIQDPIPGTFVKEGRTIYFILNRSDDQKFIILNVKSKSKREVINQLGSNFNLIFFPEENDSPNLTVNRLEYPRGNILKFEEDSLIKGSDIYVYLEKDVDKDNRRFIDNLQSTDSIITE